MKDDPISFLMEVWKTHCREGDYVFLSTKTKSGWRDHSFEFGGELQTKVEAFFDKGIAERANVYFCPTPFSKPLRKKQYVSRTRFLWSDLDSARAKGPYTPSYLWESSPGRQQALWRVAEYLEPSEAEKLNKNLTYAIGADKGGWDLSQVLRVPGTPNLKYKERPLVRLIHGPKGRTTNEVLDLLRSDPGSERTSTAALEIPDRRETLNAFKSRLRAGLLATINSKTATSGKRSEVLWSLENRLVEAGLPDDAIISILRPTVWNKYQGRADELERFVAELAKIRDKQGRRNTADPKPDQVEEEEDELPQYRRELILTSYYDLMSSYSTSPGWSVEGFWMRNSHGIIAGEPKSFKSTLSMDMAFSICSGTPFLGQFPVNTTGPVLVVQNENADWILRDRFEKVASARGEVGKAKVSGRVLHLEFPRILPMFFLSQQGFTFSDEGHCKAIEKLVEEIRPAMVVFDPLYLMFDGDISSSKDLNPYLNWLLSIKQRYNTSVVLIHHWNKNGQSQRGGQRMLGSTTLHGWVESAWYLESVPTLGPKKTDMAAANVVMEREFRGAGLHKKLQVNIQMGAFGKPQYDITVDERKEQGGEDDITAVLSGSTSPMSIRAIHLATGMTRKALQPMLDAAVSKGSIQKIGERYKLPEE